MLFFIILHSFKSIVFQNDIFLFFKMHGWSYWFWTLGSINLNWNYNFTLFCDFSISSSEHWRFNNRDLLRNLDLTRFGHLPSFLVCLPRWRHSRQGLGNIPWSFTWHLLHFLAVGIDCLDDWHLLLSMELTLESHFSDFLVLLLSCSIGRQLLLCMEFTLVSYFPWFQVWLFPCHLGW